MAPVRAPGCSVTSTQEGQSRPEQLTLFGGRVWFTAEDGTHGRELWVTDGTPSGTQLHFDIHPGSSGSSPSSLTASTGTARDRLYFAANDGASGVELWATDGTGKGTGLVKDIAPGLASSNPSEFVAWRGRMWFAATTPAQGLEIWSTDGTASGTRILLDIDPGKQSGINEAMLGYGPLLLSAGERRAWFRARTPQAGEELWVTDGTAAGTRLFVDLEPGPVSSRATPWCVAHGRLFLSGLTTKYGNEPWVLDPGASAYAIGTADGSMQLHLSGTEAILGGKSRLTLSNIEAQSAIALVFGAPAWRPRSIVPGTISYVDPATLGVLGSYGTAGPSLTWTLSIPNDTRLVGARLAVQAYALRGPGKPIDASNGVVLTAGF